ncbi:peptide ABC transporter ATP-binding protein [Comamonas serinivorans]|uniref:Peptide ABC transporter ATP-binding protein n=1 Tax=Comamonas serinivorans TaxID=1082851 RepID=A0A1Y0EKN6_9BURK|nr:ATP-binding cassette domain-containing protein [Comamonas serinivorans]ARU03991.1 peptide ABC transporter ATP-binding protein [Comamonas serinivorans]
MHTASPHAPLLQVDQLVQRYTLPRESLFRAAPVVDALKGVSLTMTAGRNLGIVGESGSGKSTLARLVMALETPTAGTVHIAGQNVHALGAAALRRARSGFQMVFQDPQASLDPRMPVWRSVAEPLAALQAVGKAAQRDAVSRVLAEVGLSAIDGNKYPHEFSGGQRQRIAIARALITKPRLIVADEPVSALDVSVQAQVLNLMSELQQRHGVTFLFISHDLAVISHLCDDLVVMRAGQVVEAGRTAEVLRAPREAYTRELLAAVA